MSNDQFSGHPPCRINRQAVSVEPRTRPQNCPLYLHTVVAIFLHNFKLRRPCPSCDVNENLMKPNLMYRVHSDKPVIQMISGKLRRTKFSWGKRMDFISVYQNFNKSEDVCFSVKWIVNKQHTQQSEQVTRDMSILEVPILAMCCYF